jgi:tight adherence protein B
MLALAVARNIFGQVLLGIIGVILPVVIVRSLQKRRRAAFDAQVVDTLVTMSASLRAGFGLLRAMQVAAQEMPPPISKEFERIVNEVGVGRPLEEALRASVARVGSYDFDLVVTAIVIHLQVGGNLSEILQTIADTIRERTKIKGEMKTLTAEGRISGSVLVVLPIALALILCWMRPEYMSVLVTDPVGPHLIWTAAILQVIGVIIMRRLLTLDI